MSMLKLFLTAAFALAEASDVVVVPEDNQLFLGVYSSVLNSLTYSIGMKDNGAQEFDRHIDQNNKLPANSSLWVSAGMEDWVA